MNILYLNGDRGNDLNRKEGYYTHITQLVMHLRQLGHRVHLLTIGEYTSIPELKSDVYFIKHTYFKFFFHKIFPYTGFTNSIRVFLKILHLNKQFKFDIIHDRFGLYSFGGVLASKFLNIPLITEVNGPVIEEKPLFTIPIKGFQLRIAQYLRSFCLYHSSRIYVVSSIVKKYLLSWGIQEKKISVIPNGANPEIFKNIEYRKKIRSVLNWSEDDIYIIIKTI